MTGRSHEKAKIELRDVRKNFGSDDVIHGLKLSI
jgi:lactose/L-arabinose transport system ATP-binding protein